MTTATIEVIDKETVVIMTPAIEPSVIEVDAGEVPSIMETSVGPRGPRGPRGFTGNTGPQGDPGLVLKSAQW